MIRHVNAKAIQSTPKPPRGKRTKVYDDDGSGFGFIKYGSGKVSFIYDYGPRGHQKRILLGYYGEMTVEQARDEFAIQRGKVKEGADPLKERERKAAVPTVEAFVEEFISLVLARKKAPDDDVRYLRWTASRWQGRKLDEITHDDIQQALACRAEVKEVPPVTRSGEAHVDPEKVPPPPVSRRVGGRIAANRWFASIRAAFEYATRAGILRENPAKYVRKFPENAPRQRVLDDDELTRVLDAVDKLDNQVERAIFQVLVSTGVRLSEALSARWTDVDFVTGFWTIPSTKSGRPQTVPLPKATLATIRKLERVEGNPYLFPGRRAGTHRAEVRDAWESIRTVAKVPDVNIHDLRRSYGKRATEAFGIHIASKLLRHSSIGITAKVYAPLLAKELVEITEELDARRSKLRLVEGGQK